MNNLMGELKEGMQHKYREYIEEYNQLADKLEVLGANNEIFKELNSLCCKALNINLDIMFYDRDK